MICSHCNPVVGQISDFSQPALFPSLPDFLFELLMSFTQNSVQLLLMSQKAFPVYYHFPSCLSFHWGKMISFSSILPYMTEILG